MRITFNHNKLCHITLGMIVLALSLQYAYAWDDTNNVPVEAFVKQDYSADTQDFSGAGAWTTYDPLSGQSLIQPADYVSLQPGMENYYGETMGEPVNTAATEDFGDYKMDLNLKTDFQGMDQLTPAAGTPIDNTAGDMMQEDDLMPPDAFPEDMPLTANTDTIPKVETPVIEPALTEPDEDPYFEPIPEPEMAMTVTNNNVAAKFNNDAAPKKNVAKTIFNVVSWPVKTVGGAVVDFGEDLKDYVTEPWVYRTPVPENVQALYDDRDKLKAEKGAAMRTAAGSLRGGELLAESQESKNTRTAAQNQVNDINNRLDINAQEISATGFERHDKVVGQVIRHIFAAGDFVPYPGASAPKAIMDLTMPSVAAANSPYTTIPDTHSSSGNR